MQAFDHDNTGVLLKTGEVMLHVNESKNIADYLAGDDLDQLDRIEAQLEKLDDVVTELDNTKADDIVFDKETETLQLIANNKPIGTALDFQEAIDATDDVINFDEDGSILIDD